MKRIFNASFLLQIYPGRFGRRRLSFILTPLSIYVAFFRHDRFVYITGTNEQIFPPPQIACHHFHARFAHGFSTDRSDFTDVSRSMFPLPVYDGTLMLIIIGRHMERSRAGADTGYLFSMPLQVDFSSTQLAPS